MHMMLHHCMQFTCPEFMTAVTEYIHMSVEVYVDAVKRFIVACVIVTLIVKSCIRGYHIQDYFKRRRTFPSADLHQLFHECDTPLPCRG